MLVFGFLSPFGVPAFASGSSCPAAELGLPCGRLTGHTEVWSDLNGVSTFHTSEMRPGWAPSIPRGWRCSSRPRMLLWPSACRFPAASPWTPLNHPIGGASRNEASSRVHWYSPVRSSPGLWPLDGTAALGLDRLSFAPRRYQRRTSGWGQAIEHRPGLHLRHHRPPICVSTQLVRPRVAPRDRDCGRGDDQPKQHSHDGHSRNARDESVENRRLFAAG